MTRFLARSFTILALSMISSSVFAAGDIDCRLYGATAQISYAPQGLRMSTSVSAANIPSESSSKKFNVRLIKATSERECIEIAKIVAMKSFLKTKPSVASAFVSRGVSVTSVTISYIGAAASQVTFDTSGNQYWPTPSKSPSTGSTGAVSTQGRY